MGKFGSEQALPPIDIEKHAYYAFLVSSNAVSWAQHFFLPRGMVLRYHPCPSISELIPDEDTLELYRQYELAGHGETGLSGLSLKEKQVIERLRARQQDLPLLNMLLQALRIPGLRPGFMAGNINRLLRMKCPHVGTLATSRMSPNNQKRRLT